MENIDIHSICEKSCAILRATSDGNELSPGHLSLIEGAANGFLTEKGYEKFEEIYNQVLAGEYIKPWHCGVEFLTKDHEGYIYWKGLEVEHYSFQDYEKEKAAAVQLAEKCKYIESRSLPVSSNTVIWHYDLIKSMPDKDLKWWPIIRGIYHFWGYGSDILHLQMHDETFYEFNRNGGITARGNYGTKTYEAYHMLSQTGYYAIFKHVKIDLDWPEIKSLFNLYQLTLEHFK